MARTQPAPKLYPTFAEIDPETAADEYTDTAPWADSTEDVTTRTIPLEGGTAIVEHVDNRAEVTIRLGDRIICAVALSTSEAQQLGMALARPGGWTVGDYWDIHDQLYPTGVYARPDSLATGGAR